MLSGLDVVLGQLISRLVGLMLCSKTIFALRASILLYFRAWLAYCALGGFDLVRKKRLDAR